MGKPVSEQLQPDRADQLAMAARSGDPAALATLYEKLGPSLLGFLQHLLKDRSAAEDLLHDTFLRLFEGRGSYRPRGNLKAWLFTVARRLAMDTLRADKRHRELEEQMPDISARGSSHPLETRELNAIVERTLASLPAGYATTFHLRISQEFTYPEIAAICGEPEGTLRSRVHHTLGLLRKGLKND
jgi:RNA polymerase sigma-70 factor, ECF subfamily